jgi:hypothetical protein
MHGAGREQIRFTPADRQQGEAGLSPTILLLQLCNATNNGSGRAGVYFRARALTREV